MKSPRAGLYDRRLITRSQGGLHKKSFGAYAPQSSCRKSSSSKSTFDDRRVVDRGRLTGRGESHSRWPSADSSTNPFDIKNWLSQVRRSLKWPRRSARRRTDDDDACLNSSVAVACAACGQTSSIDQRPRPEAEWVRTPKDDTLRIITDDLWARVAARRREIEGKAIRFASGRLSGRPPKHASCSSNAAGAPIRSRRFPKFAISCARSWRRCCGPRARAG